jgi:hemoglobin-like flavoprotein
MIEHHWQSVEGSRLAFSKSISILSLRHALSSRRRPVAALRSRTSRARARARAMEGSAVITDEEKAAIKESWRLVVPIAETAADLFYKKLFELRPEYRRLFSEDMRGQKRKLLAMLGFIVKALDWPDSAWREEVAEEDDLCLILLALGRRHTDLYRVPDAAYEAVAEALLWTLDYGLGKKFDAAARDAWTQVYTLVATTMKMGRLSVQPREEGDRALRGIIGATARGAAS